MPSDCLEMVEAKTVAASAAGIVGEYVLLALLSDKEISDAERKGGIQECLNRLKTQSQIFGVSVRSEIAKPLLDRVCNMVIE